AAEVLARQALLDELDAVLGGLFLALVLRGHDGDPLGRNAYVPQDEREHPLADAAEADAEDPSRKLDVNFVLVAHDVRCLFAPVRSVSIGCGRLNSPNASAGAPPRAFTSSEAGRC